MCLFFTNTLIFKDPTYSYILAYGETTPTGRDI